MLGQRFTIRLCLIFLFGWSAAYGTTPFIRTFVSHNEGRGIGYPTGYSTVGLFLSPIRFMESPFQPFLDLRGHILNNHKLACSVGGGLRYIVPDSGTVLGFNAFYDYRQDRRGFHQIGLGVEQFSCSYDVMANAYISLSRDPQYLCFQEVSYQGNFFADGGCRQRGMSGADLLFGTRLSKWCPCVPFDFFAYVGPYYYRLDVGCYARGGRIRVGVSYLEYISLEYIGTYDHVLRDTHQARIVLSIPLYGCEFCRYKSNCCCNNPRHRALQPVQRQDIVPISSPRCFWNGNWN